MKLDRSFTEETILFLDVLKWFLLATVVGTVVGCATALFLKVIEWSTTGENLYSGYYYTLPLGLLFSTVIIKYLSPDSEGHGTEKVIEAIHKRHGKIKPIVVPVKTVATVATIACGGSVGKEGPAAQIGGGITSWLAGQFGLNKEDRRKLVVCGISAGFASVFGTPIAGAVFGVEVLFIGSIHYDILLPSFVSGIMGYQMAKTLGIEYFAYPVNVVPAFTEAFFVKIALAGIYFGLCSALLIGVLNYFKRIAERIKLRPAWKALIGGFVLVLLTMMVGKDFLGLGHHTIVRALKGHEVLWYAFIIKILFTSITLNFGGSGGIVTPIFFIGATSGALLAQVFDLNVATFAAIGLVSVLAGAANTPIAASIMAVELFGPFIAPYAAVSCVISFLMTGHRSVYPSQIISGQKVSAISVQLGEEIEDIRPRFISESRGLKPGKSILVRFKLKWRQFARRATKIKRKMDQWARKMRRDQGQ